MNPAEKIKNNPRGGSKFWNSPWLMGAILMGATLAVFRNFLLPSTSRILSIPGGDLSDILIWWYQFGFAELQKGHLALWNPYLCGGIPFFGGFQCALLYPPNWLFMVLPLPFALNLNMALHVFLSGTFTFLWFRARGSHVASAMIGAFGFMFGGATFLHIVPGHLPNIDAMTWIPLVFWAVEVGIEKVQRKWILLGMGAISMQILSGHIQYTYYTVFTVSLYVLLNLPRARKKISFLASWAAMGIGAGLLTALQLLAGWEAAAESVRTQHLSMDFLNIASITPERLWCLLMPNFFGGWKDYWGGSFYWEGVLYISVTAFVLALFALGACAHAQKKMFFAIALFLGSLAIGTHFPLFAFFCRYFPGFGNFRGVGKLSALISLCLLALSAMGMDEIFRRPESLKGFARWTGWGSGLFFFATGLFYSVPRLGGGRVFHQYLIYANSMTLSLLLCGVFLWGLALLARASQRWLFLRWLFPLTVFLELFIFSSGNLPFFDFKEVSAKASKIQEIYSHEPGDYRISAPSPDMTLGARCWDIWGEDPFNSLRYAQFVCATQGLDVEKDSQLIPFFRQWPPSLGLLRLRYRIQEEGHQWRLEKTGFHEPPRVFLNNDFEILKRDEILSRTLQATFDPTKKVLLESDPGILSGAPARLGQVSLKDLSSDEIEINADLIGPALMVITDNFSRGWKIVPISGDGQKQYRILPANGFQRAVPLLEGHHHFYMEYRPDFLEAGRWISLLSWICFFALFVLKRRSL